MIGGISGVRDDVIPYGLARRHLCASVGPEYRRACGAGSSPSSGWRWSDRSSTTCSTAPVCLPIGWSGSDSRASEDPAIAEILAFIDDGKARGGRHRSLCMPKPPTADVDASSGRYRTGHGRVVQISSPIGLIAGGGVLPFAVADSLLARGITPMIFALSGFCDPARSHALSPSLDLDRPVRPVASSCCVRENCRDLMFIGSLVRPSLSRSSARLGHGSGARARDGGISRRRRSSAVRHRPRFSNATAFGCWASRTSPPTC